MQSEESADLSPEGLERSLERSEDRAEFAEQCTPGYYNSEGKPGRHTRQNFFYFGGPMEFVELLEAWRAEGGMKGLELS
jgi:hypothetical protein